VLAIKAAATVEMMRMLYARETSGEIKSLWGYSISAGLLFALLVFLFGFEPRALIASPLLVYARQIGQAFLAVVALSMALFAWAFHRNTATFTTAHSWLMTILWLDYALIGLMSPATGSEWRLLDNIWTTIATLAMIGWTATVTPTLRRATGRCWWWIVRVLGLRGWWLVRLWLLFSLWHRSKSPSE